MVRRKPNEGGRAYGADVHVTVSPPAKVMLNGKLTVEVDPDFNAPFSAESVTEYVESAYEKNAELPESIAAVSEVANVTPFTAVIVTYRPPPLEDWVKLVFACVVNPLL